MPDVADRPQSDIELDRMKAVALPLLPDPSEHALVLIDINGGDYLAAWTHALLVLRYTPKNDLPQRQYWSEVAEAIANSRLSHTEPQFMRGSRFADPRRTTT
jgi:hypothetical protein